jgi:hypothetical protein
MLAVQEGSSPSWRHAMWTAESRAFVAISAPDKP